MACVRPEPMKTIADPACGTGGFFLGACYWLTRTGQTLNKRQAAFLNNSTFFGNEIVPGTRRLCLMNLVLHSIVDMTGDRTGEPLIDRADALLTKPARTFDDVLANPPFGKTSSMTFTNAEGEDDRESLTYERRDFWTTTSNKPLNFLQHIVSVLGSHGKAAVVLPDNVLFEGGAGEKIRRKWLETCDVHTILRLPTGIFYAGREGQRGVFRCPAQRRCGVNQGRVVLRPARQPALHAEDAAAGLRRSARLRRPLQPRQPPLAAGQ